MPGRGSGIDSNRDVLLAEHRVVVRAVDAEARGADPADHVRLGAELAGADDEARARVRLEGPGGHADSQRRDREKEQELAKTSHGTFLSGVRRAMGEIPSWLFAATPPVNRKVREDDERASRVRKPCLRSSVIGQRIAYPLGK